MKHIFSKWAALLCSMAMLLTMLPLTAAATGDDGDWTFFSEDFSSYEAGTNAFYNADTDHYAYTRTRTDQTETADTFAIQDDGDENQYLEFLLHGVGQTSADYLRVTLKDKVSGEFSVEWDYRPADNQISYSNNTRTETDSMMIEILPGVSVRHGVHGGSYVYATAASGLVSSAASLGSLKTTANQAMTYTAYQWYHVRTDVTEGKIVVSIYERGDDTKIGGADITIATLTKAKLAAAHTVYFTVGQMGTYPDGVVYKVGLDNVKLISHDFAQYIPSAVEMASGDSVSLSVPQTYRKLCSVTTTSDAVSIGSAGQIAAEKAGEGTVIVNCINALDGTVSKSFPVSVTVTADAEKITGGDLTFALADVGTTQNLALTVPTAVQTAYPGYSFSCVSLDESIASVDNSGIVTAVAQGRTTVTAFLLDGSGNKTPYFTTVTVTVGKPQLKVLSIGNSYSRDSLHYLRSLGKMVGEDLYTAYLYTGSCTLRMHANAAMYNVPIYTYFKCKDTAPYFSGTSNSTMADALADEQWDIITLHQGVTYSGMEGTYGGGDLDFLLDYIKDTNPQAQIYWNMTWSLASNSTHESFQDNFDGSPIAQYNATVDNINNYIKTDDRIDGVIHTGEAVQLARSNATITAYDSGSKLDLLRDTLHLAYNRGRLISAMTWLKTLCPDADLSTLTSSAITAMFNNGSGESNAATYADDCTTMTDELLDAIRSCVTTAVNTEPTKLAYSNKNTVSASVATTLLQTPAPYKLHFPDVTTMDDGTVFLTAYQNVSHTPTIYNDNMVSTYGAYDPMTTTEGNSNAPVKHYAEIGAGKLVLYRSTDNGSTWTDQGTDDQPLLVIDQKQLSDWGLANLYGNYGKLKKANKLPLASDTSEKIAIYSDPRDGNVMSVHTDVNGDGVKENLLTYTFWIRNFYQNATNASALYIVTSADGGNTWTNPVKLKNVKRGDLTEFADGEILVPEYGGNNAYAERLKWVDGNWKSQGQSVIAQKSDTVSHTEPSLFAPEGGDTVYALLRSSGYVMRSTDRGATWTQIADEDTVTASLRSGTLEQPGFCSIDGFRTFVTYVNNGTSGTRPVYGAMLYLDGDSTDAYGWADSNRQNIYTSPTSSAHDTGDPSSTYLQNGKVLVVHYDTAYRSILGNFIDITENEWMPTEQKTYVQSEGTVRTGKSLTLQSFAANADGTAPIEWTSSDESIATVDNGIVTSLKNGTVTITATSGGVSATCTVTVENILCTISGTSATVSVAEALGDTMAVAFYDSDNRMVKFRTADITDQTAEITINDSNLNFANLTCRVFFFNSDWKPADKAQNATIK